MVASSSVVQSGLLCGNLVELLPKQLYFASFKEPPHKADPHVRYIDLDNRVSPFVQFLYLLVVLPLFFVLLLAAVTHSGCFASRLRRFSHASRLFEEFRGEGANDQKNAENNGGWPTGG